MSKKHDIRYGDLDDIVAIADGKKRLSRQEVRFLVANLAEHLRGLAQELIESRKRRA